MAKQLDGEEMRTWARVLNEELNGLGFCLITFEFDKSGDKLNYISNAHKLDIIKALKETVKILESGTHFMTPKQ